MSDFLNSVQLPGGQQTPAAPVTPTPSGFLSKVQTPEQIQSSQQQVQEAQKAHTDAFTLSQTNQPVVKFEAPKVAESSSMKVPSFTEVFPETVKMIQSIIPDLTKFTGTDRTANNGLGQGHGEAGKALWDGIKDPVLAEAQNIKDYFDANSFKTGSPAKSLGSGLKVIAGAGNIVFSPITALFSGAKQVPILASISDIVSAPFVALGEGATGISNSIVDQLPISKEAKAQIAPGLGQVFALAAQIELGHYVDPIAKFKELTSKFGSVDAQTIVDKAQELADHKINLNPDQNASVKSDFIAKTEIKSPETLYHFTTAENAKLIQEKGFNVPIDPEGTTGISFSRNPDLVKQFGNTKIEAYLKSDAKIIKLNDIPKEFQTDFSAPKYALDHGYDALDFGDRGFMKEVRILNRDAIEVPQQPLETSGKQVPNSRAITLEKAAVERKLTDGLGDLPTHDQMDMKEQASKAVDYIDQNPEHALNVAKGDALAPPGVLPESIYTALEARAIAQGDIPTLMELANSKLPTLAGQSLKALDSSDPNSPVKIMRDIQNAREASVKPKEVIKETASIKDEIKTEKSNNSSKRQSWESFIEQIKCN